METVWCIASPYDWLNVVYTAVAFAVVHFLTEVLVYSTYTIITGGPSDIKHHYFISPWSGQDNYLASLYHCGPISPWVLVSGFSLKNFLSSRWSLPVRCVCAILCIHVCVCVCVCLCVCVCTCVYVYVLTVCFMLFSATLHHQYTSGLRVWCGWYVSNGDCEQRDGPLWLLPLHYKADLIISIVILSACLWMLAHGCCCTFVQPQLCSCWMVVDELLHRHTRPPSISWLFVGHYYARNEFTNYLNATFAHLYSHHKLFQDS